MVCGFVVSGCRSVLLSGLREHLYSTETGETGRIQVQGNISGFVLKIEGAYTFRDS